MSLVGDLANIIYTPEGIAAAGTYLAGRGVDIGGMRFPAAVTGKDSTPFKYLSKHLPSHLFCETIYFPVTDIENPAKLIGFDARYLGEDKSRLRYRKFKEEGCGFLLYYTMPLHEIDPAIPLIVTEGVMDAETIRPLGFPVITPLTAMHSLKFCCFLSAISRNIYIAYDNDTSGQTAVKNIVRETKIDADFCKYFKVLNFRGKDLNNALQTNGREYLFDILKSQLF